MRAHPLARNRIEAPSAAGGPPTIGVGGLSFWSDRPARPSYGAALARSFPTEHNRRLSRPIGEALFHAAEAYDLLIGLTSALENFDCLRLSS